TRPFVAVVRHQADAIGLENVERVRDLAQAAFDIWQRKRGEEAEPGWMVAHELCGVFVAAARDTTRGLHVAEPDARIGNRYHRRIDAMLIHLAECALRRPLGNQSRTTGGGAENRPRGLDECRREDVMVHVDHHGPALGGWELRQSVGGGCR